MTEILLILDDAKEITEALAIGLEREGRSVILCNDVESAEIAVEHYGPGIVLADLQFTGAFSFEGFAFIDHVRKHAPQAAVILMSGFLHPSVQDEAARRGARFVQKPFGLDDIEQIVAEVPGGAPGRDGLPPVLSIPMLDEILDSPALVPKFQSVHRLRDRERPFGFESLARLRLDLPFANPEILFDYAKRKGRVRDLELACIARTLRHGHRLASAGTLFMNVNPAVFSAPALADVLIERAAEYSVPLDRVVLEVTEQAPLRDPAAAFRTMDRLRERGVRFALDDVGIAYSHLTHIDSIRPSFLKISQHFGGGFERDPTKVKIVGNLLNLASDFSAELILEGIETAETADAATSIGVALGQGYFFGRPEDAV